MQRNLFFQNTNAHHSIASYTQALRAKQLDWSDYVLLSTKIISEIIGPSSFAQLKIVRICYLKNQKKSAIKELLAICDRHNDESLKLIKQKVVTLLDNPLAQESRRYFETRFSHALWRSLKIEEFASLSKLAVLIKEIDPEIEIPVMVTNHEDAELVIDRMEKCEHDLAIAKKITTLMSSSALYQTKDKNRTKRRIESSHVSLSYNHGVMKSIASNPVDERVAVLTNRHPDISMIDRNIQRGYSASRTDVPFVNSLSGHTFILVALLEIFVKKYHTNDNQVTLAKDIHHLLKIFVAFTCKRGFHSLAEMFDVLMDPSIKTVLSASGIVINFDFSESILTSVFEHATNHAKTLCLKRLCHSEINSKDMKQKIFTRNKPSTEIRTLKVLEDMALLRYRKNALIIFDLDNTVMKPVNINDLGSDQWFAKFITQCFNVISNRYEALSTAVTIRNAIHKYIRMNPVEWNVANIIKSLQEASIPVLALTARGPSIIETTEKQLQSIDVDFSKQWINTRTRIEFDKVKQSSPVYQKGIIYCDGADKGVSLRMYLQAIRFSADNYIMVDDTEKNLVCVENSVKELGKSFVGLRYSYLDKAISSFDMSKATAKLSQLSSLFSTGEKSELEKCDVDRSSNSILYGSINHI
ncbi:MAG: DUF2608 domain-containing protein [Gammaproteobacteria bacterium]